MKSKTMLGEELKSKTMLGEELQRSAPPSNTKDSTMTIVSCQHSSTKEVN